MLVKENRYFFRSWLSGWCYSIITASSFALKKFAPSRYEFLKFTLDKSKPLKSIADRSRSLKSRPVKLEPAFIFFRVVLYYFTSVTF
jgi:hypothetical protein